MKAGSLRQRNRFEAPEVRRNKARSEAAAELRVYHSKRQKVAAATGGTVDSQTGAIEPPLVQRFRHPLTGVLEFGTLTRSFAAASLRALFRRASGTIPANPSRFGRSAHQIGQSAIRKRGLTTASPSCGDKRCPPVHTTQHGCATILWNEFPAFRLRLCFAGGTRRATCAGASGRIPDDGAAPSRAAYRASKVCRTR